MQSQPISVGTQQPSSIKINEDVMEIIPLGAGNEVGRSAVIVQFKGKTVLFDCGVHPAYTGFGSLPFFDQVDLSTIDLCLVTHFHLDHCGAVPYLTEHTDFRGKVFMTHPTKAIYKLVLSDSVKVSDTPSDEMLFNEQDLKKSLEKIEEIDYHQEKEHKGIKFWCYNAGHVLGAAMFMIEIAGIRVLYTGDFSRHPDRHLMGAETPTISPDVLIVESTYGIQVHEPRRDRETRFTQLVHDIIKRGGRCLIPVFALGRSQELLLILDEYWENHRELHNIKIYYSSNLARKSLKVFQQYINMMNEKIRKQFEISNPFKFKYIFDLKSLHEFDDTEPCVVMASPGMLQSGMSRDLFERWCSDPRNGVVLPGYSTDGTLAKKIQAEPPTIQLSNGLTVPLKMTIASISFSAHSDKEQTEEFVSSINPSHIVLVHGDKLSCARLKEALNSKFNRPDEAAADGTSTSGAAVKEPKAQKIQLYTPKNCQTIRVVFRGEKKATVLGTLAEKPPKENDHVSGVLIHKDFQYNVVAPQDMKLFDVPCTSIRQKLFIPLSSKASIEDWQEVYGKRLQKQYSKVKLLHKPNEPLSEETISALGINLLAANSNEQQGAKFLIFKVEDAIIIKFDPEKPTEAILEWESSTAKDLIVDSLCHFFMNLNDSSVEDSDEEMADAKQETSILYTIQQLLMEHFVNVRLDIEKGNLIAHNIGKAESPIIVDRFGKIIQCEDETIRSRLEIIMKRLYFALFPMPSMMGCLDEHDHSHDHDQEMHDH